MVDQLLAENAKIVDVRTPGEFAGGHVPGSINVPLDQLEKGMKKLKKDEPIVLCCASGMRSSMATSKFQSAGFSRVANGGSWSSVYRKMNR